MDDRIKLTVRVSDDFFVFRTYSRKQKRSSSFYMSRVTLEKVFSKGRTVSFDGVSNAVLWHNEEQDTVVVRFSWLHLHSDNTLIGREETVRLPGGTFRAFVQQSVEENGPKEWKALSIPERFAPHLVFRSRRNLKAVAGNKLVYRKFLKVLRRNFERKRADEIIFYDDSVPYSFFFQEMYGDRLGVCGGVILHNYHNDLATAEYGVHT